jgi:hypothetical protein
MLDYGGGFFNGSNYWLEIGVKTNNNLNYVTLNPLQPFTPAPYSLFAMSASNVTGIVDVSQVNGTLSEGQLPPDVVYDGADSLTLSGSFSGDGSGLTNFATGNFVYARNSLIEYIPEGNTNIVFGTNSVSGMIQGWSFTNNTADFYCPANGRYLVQYSASAISSNAPVGFSASVSLNGNGIGGTGTAGVAVSTNFPTEISGFSIVKLSAGDNVSLRLSARTGGVTLLPGGPGNGDASLMITPLPVDISTLKAKL